MFDKFTNLITLLSDLDRINIKSELTPELREYGLALRADDSPSICWHPSDRWIAKVGYNLVPTIKTMPTPGRRSKTPTSRYLGSDHTAPGKKEAELRACLFRVAWRAHVKSWPLIRKQGELTLPEFNWAKPVWIDSPMLRKAILHPRHGTERATPVTVTAPLTVSNITSVPTPNDLTVRQLKDRYIIYRRTRLGRMPGKGINAKTFYGERNILNFVINSMPWADSRLSALIKPELQFFVDHWHAANNGITPRTAKNYCVTFYAMLRWAQEQDDIDYMLPKGSGRLFRFPNVNPINIVRYNPEQLVAFRLAATCDVYLYFLLGLLGMYQGDIAHLRFGAIVDGTLRYIGQNGEVYGEIVRVEPSRSQGNIVIPLKYKEIKAYDGSYDMYIYRLRDRIRHKAPLNAKALTWVFPEAGKRIASLLAPEDNPYALCFLDHRGRPLLESNPDNGGYDSISPRFSRGVVRAKWGRRLDAITDGLSEDEAESQFHEFRLTFKQLRKIGTTAVAELGSDEVARMYRSELPGGSAKFYQLDAFVRKLTPVLKLWADELRRDKVLVERQYEGLGG
jgi:hypothetical protein